jgi:hypothetical protein
VKDTNLKIWTTSIKNSTMTTNKGKSTKQDPIRAAEEEAEKDILNDPELSDSDPTDDLDEGELAQQDNSDEEAFDELEKKRPAPGHHSGKGKEK